MDWKFRFELKKTIRKPGLLPAFGTHYNHNQSVLTPCPVMRPFFVPLCGRSEIG